MAKSLVLAVALLATAPPPPPPAASPLCIPANGDEAKTVGWLRGAYGVLGSRSGPPYTGQLTLSGTEASESLDVAGTVDGSPRQGVARYVHCGPDRVRQLKIALVSGQVFFCVPHIDYDNFNRLSCSRSLSDPNGDHELWIQRYVPY